MCFSRLFEIAKLDTFFSNQITIKLPNVRDNSSLSTLYTQCVQSPNLQFPCPAWDVSQSVESTKTSSFFLNFTLQLSRQEMPSSWFSKLQMKSKIETSKYEQLLTIININNDFFHLNIIHKQCPRKLKTHPPVRRYNVTNFCPGFVAV